MSNSAYWLCGCSFDGVRENDDAICRSCVIVVNVLSIILFLSYGLTSASTFILIRCTILFGLVRYGACIPSANDNGNRFAIPAYG